MKDTDWFNPTNQQLLNTVSIMTTSSDYRTLNSSPLKPATWIVSSEKPSKLRCIPITSTEMGDTTSANPGSHCYTNSRKGDSHRVHYSDRTRTYIPPPLHNLLCTYPPPSCHSPSIGSSTGLPEPCSGINTPHIPYPVILHPPAYEDGTDSVLKHWLLELRHRGITQKKTHYSTIKLVISDGCC